MRAALRQERLHVCSYLLLYVLYLLTLFFVASVGDSDQPGHTALRIVGSAVELAVYVVAGIFLLRRWWASRRIAWWLLYVTVSASVCLIYLAQLYSLYLSNNFASVLALRNLRFASFGTTGRAVALLAFGVVWIVFVAANAWPARTRSRIAVPRDDNHQHVSILIKLPLIALALLAYAYLFTQQRENSALEPGYRQIPVASMVVNTLLSFRSSYGSDFNMRHAGAGDTEGKCFNNPHAGKTPGYPFQKPVVYDVALKPSPGAGGAPRPNVIVLFTEGTSTRLLGSYGGKYPDLTPNIDELADRSMKVVHYFNHTAATFRGITGETTSGFVFSGGESGWASATDSDSLLSINRQSIAGIVNAQGYDTFFFSPEHSPSAKDNMLTLLGFGKFYGYEQISELLHGRVIVQDKTDQLDDGSLFKGLTAFLQARTAKADVRPFLIGAYNIGTHAFIPMVKGGAKYGEGDSQLLNKLHNYDASLGQFLDYFYKSGYAKNTILIFTSDHSTYPDKSYREVAGANLRPFFVDTIPLLVYDPMLHLPRTLDANGRNSLDLAPTILHLLGIKDAPNSFIGTSLFEARSLPVGISAIGDDFYVTTSAGVRPVWELSGSSKSVADCEQAVVESYYRIERENRLFKSGPGPTRNSLNSSDSNPGAP